MPRTSRAKVPVKVLQRQGPAACSDSCDSGACQAFRQATPMFAFPAPPQEFQRKTRSSVAVLGRSPGASVGLGEWQLLRRPSHCPLLLP